MPHLIIDHQYLDQADHQQVNDDHLMSRACAISALGIIAGLPPARAPQQCWMPTLMRGGCEYHRQPDDHHCRHQPDHHLCDYIITGPQGCLILIHCSVLCNQKICDISNL